jgi:hypothetical protein
VAVIAVETNWYDKKFLRKIPNLKLKSRNIHWKERSRNEIAKLLGFFLLEVLHQKKVNELFFLEENSGNIYIFGTVH